MASTSAQACVYASLILQDDGIEVTSDKLQKIIKKANISVEPIWCSLFAKALEGKDLKDVVMNVGAASGAAPQAAASGSASQGQASEAKQEEKKEEAKEESDEDMGFGLFD